MCLMYSMVTDHKQKQDEMLKHKKEVTVQTETPKTKKVTPRSASQTKQNSITKKEVGSDYVIHDVTVTAYDLSVQSCGKPIGSRGYGMTASGYDISNKSRKEAKTIAVDPRVIPLGKKVEITFKEPHLKKYNGIYIARDTGGAIKGNKIDLFMGDFRSNKPAAEAVNFGVQKATVKVFA